MTMKKVSGDLAKNRDYLDRQLGVGESFDVLYRNVEIGKKNAALYMIDGFCKDEVMQKLLQHFIGITKEQMPEDAAEMSRQLVPYGEVDLCDDLDEICRQVMSGVTALLLEGYEQGILIDARTYPARSVGEPEKDKVLRGSKDGFVETIVFNTALIRRRVRDVRLRMEHVQVGETKDDVVLCSLAGCRDEQLYAALKKRLCALQVHSLTMAQESLAEVLFDKHWWNPFPLVRYTERPDVASAHVQEGGIVVITDNSPSVMLLPVTLMDFVQEAQDYYFPPLIGTYLRIIRILIFLLAQFLTPVWFWLNSNPDLMPEVFRFTLIDGGANISIFWQLIILEIGIDAMKMASLNTPSSLSSSFSIIGALILGDFAVKAGWFDAEIILYMAFAALANFTQPSFELGYAIKLVRMLMLAVIALFPAYGLWIALALLVLLLISSRAPGTRGYLYPLIPFDAHACGKMLLRRPLHNKRKDENK